MTTPPLPGPQLSALSDSENVAWKEVEETEKLSEEAAYWRLRGMIPPAIVDLEE